MRLPVGPAGSTLTSSYNRAEYHGTFVAVGQTGPGLPFSGSTQNAAVNWQYPELRSSTRNLYLTGGLAWDNSRSHESGQNSLTTNIMLLQLSGFYNKLYDNQSSLTFNGSLWTNGKHFVNAKAASTNSERRAAAHRAGHELPASVRERWSFAAQVNATYSVNPLTDADKYNLGGPGSVLGYQSAEQRGDSGYFASGEVQRSFASSPVAHGWWRVPEYRHGLGQGGRRLGRHRQLQRPALHLEPRPRRPAVPVREQAQRAAAVGLVPRPSSHGRRRGRTYLALRRDDILI